MGEQVGATIQDVGGRKFVGSLLIWVTGTALLLVKLITSSDWLDLSKIVLGMYMGVNLGEKIVDLIGGLKITSK